MARKTISEEKQNLIRKRLLQGHSIKDIAQETGVSEKTVSKYKRNAPEPLKVSASSEDIELQIDYTTVLTKREEFLAKKILKEVALYEDEVEGWSYHLTAHDDRIRQQGMWWSFIVYDDSVPENWLERLQATGMQIALSPWHDKDTWNHDSPEMVNAETGEIIPKGARYKMGDRKKMHRHGIVKTDKKCSWREMNTFLQNMLHCPYIQKCRSLRNAFAPCFIDFLKDTLPILVKVIDLSAFRCPLSARLDTPHGEHDMGVRISVPLIVQTPIRTHSFFGLLFYKISNCLYLFFSAQFFG